ncbi:MAG: type II toxin-antitoxin system VapB family antitoxin [Bacteroidetes bacterium]|nr:type II toxin-antitoxin system VapB family antitoxin [Bacteroidota bacterium]
MAFNIKNAEADRLARELVKRTGQNLTDVVLDALRDKLEHVSGRRRLPGLREDISRIQERVAALPILDGRCDDDILGYDEHGLAN